METEVHNQSNHISPENEKILRGLLEKVDRGENLTDKEERVWKNIKTILEE